MIYLVRMRPKFRAAAVALVLVGALSASGRASEAPAADPTPTPSATPLFASDEEALAAAEEAYAAYLAVTDEIYAEGGAGIEKLATVTAGKQLSEDTRGFAEVERLGLHSIGATTYDGVELQQFDRESEEGKGVVTIYVCQDVSLVDVFDASGSSVVRTNRPDRTRFEVKFDGDSESSGLSLRVSGVVPWEDPTC